MPGANPTVDRAVRLEDEVNRFLRQPMSEITPAEHAWRQLADVLHAERELATT